MPARCMTKPANRSSSISACARTQLPANCSATPLTATPSSISSTAPAVSRDSQGRQRWRSRRRSNRREETRRERSDNPPPSSPDSLHSLIAPSSPKTPNPPPPRTPPSQHSNGPHDIASPRPGAAGTRRHRSSRPRPKTLISHPFRDLFAPVQLLPTQYTLLYTSNHLALNHTLSSLFYSIS